jgi:hypothetical protein
MVYEVEILYESPLNPISFNFRTGTGVNENIQLHVTPSTDKRRGNRPPDNGVDHPLVQSILVPQSLQVDSASLVKNTFSR